MVAMTSRTVLALAIAAIFACDSFSAVEWEAAAPGESELVRCAYRAMGSGKPVWLPGAHSFSLGDGFDVGGSNGRVWIGYSGPPLEAAEVIERERSMRRIHETIAAQCPALPPYSTGTLTRDPGKGACW